MSERTQRLERYLEEEMGECRDQDISDRLDSLEAIQEGLDTDTIDSDVEILSALGDRTRYQITRILAEADGQLCVCEITPLLEVSDSAVSHALTNLTEAGLVRRNKDGRWRKYELTSRAHALLVALDGAR